MTEHTKPDARLYANLSLGLFIAGLLVPFILAAIGGPALGIGFGVLSEVLALLFGILGWAHTRARVAVISIVVLFVVAGGMSALRWHACQRPARVVATSQPLTLREARQQGCPIELPEGAGNISFAAYGQWQAHEVYVRFEAPLDVCKAHALRIVRKHNSESPDRAVPEELRAANGPFEPVKTSAPINISWFDVDRIKSALVVRPSGPDAGPHQPGIWIDADRNVFYYVYTD